MDDDLAALITAPSSAPLLSVLLPAPRVSPDDFLQLPLAGEPLLWDGACWGESVVAARSVVTRWVPEEGESLADMARRISAALAAAEVRAVGVPAEGPRCHGGLAFDPKSPGRDWSDFGAASFFLPRLVYEADESHARLRLTLSADDPREPWVAKIKAVQERLRSLPPASAWAPGQVEARWSGAQSAWKPGARLLDDSAQAYQQAVAAALRAIERGTFDKVVVARALSLDVARFDLPTALARLAGPSLVRFALERRKSLFFGATPERLVSFDGERVTTEALAGSIARGDHEASARELLSSDKDQREHRMVVEAITRALSQLCSEIEAPPQPGIRALRHLLHLATPITARAAAPTHVLDLVRLLHPTPAVCGLPREESAAWLRKHEGLKRGWYAAPIGWFDGQGRGSFAVALRSALVRGREGRVFVGAGVVRGSTPEGELGETRLKARAMLEALGVES